MTPSEEYRELLKRIHPGNPEIVAVGMKRWERWRKEVKESDLRGM